MQAYVRSVRRIQRWWKLQLLEIARHIRRLMVHWNKTANRTNLPLAPELKMEREEQYIPEDVARQLPRVWCPHPQIYPSPPIPIRTHMRTHMRTHLRTHMRMHMRTHMRACMRACGAHQLSALRMKSV
jgi:hypothetical protein